MTTHPSRWTAAQRVGGCGAAAAMLPYLLIKIFWAVDGLRGGGLKDGVWSVLDWGVLNAVTVGMSGLGIVLAMALAQPWGVRVPALLLLLPAWVAVGFLVSMILILPTLLLTSVAGAETSSADSNSVGTSSAPAALPPWELTMIGLAFTGFALGLVVPGYVLQRWPEAFAGRVDAVAARVGPVEHAVAKIAAALCVVLAAPQAVWAMGGTLGLDPAGLGGRDLQWHLLTANNALCALLAAWTDPSA